MTGTPRSASCPTAEGRSPLSKDVLLGQRKAAGIRLVTADSLEALDITAVEPRVIALDQVTSLLTLSDGTLDYDDGVIATGPQGRQVRHRDHRPHRNL